MRNQAFALFYFESVSSFSTIFGLDSRVVLTPKTAPENVSCPTNRGGHQETGNKDDHQGHQDESNRKEEIEADQDEEDGEHPLKGIVSVSGLRICQSGTSGA